MLEVQDSEDGFLETASGMTLGDGELTPKGREVSCGDVFLRGPGHTVRVERSIVMRGVLPCSCHRVAEEDHIICGHGNRSPHMERGRNNLRQHLSR